MPAIIVWITAAAASASSSPSLCGMKIDGMVTLPARFSLRIFRKRGPDSQQ